MQRRQEFYGLSKHERNAKTGLKLTHQIGEGFSEYVSSAVLSVTGADDVIGVFHIMDIDETPENTQIDSEMDIQLEPLIPEFGAEPDPLDLMMALEQTISEGELPKCSNLDEQI